MQLLYKELQLVNLNDAYVVPSVAYPFISKNEFYDKALNKISDERLTFTLEDFENFEVFNSKVNKIFDMAYQQINNPNLVKNCFNTLSFNKARTYFEGENFSETSEQTEVEFPHKSQENLFSIFIYIGQLNIIALL